MGSFPNEENREKKEGSGGCSFLPFEAPRNAERNPKTVWVANSCYITHSITDYETFFTFLYIILDMWNRKKFA